jgi:peroxiredoxin
MAKPTIEMASEPRSEPEMDPSRIDGGEPELDELATPVEDRGSGVSLRRVVVSLAVVLAIAVGLFFLDPSLFPGLSQRSGIGASSPVEVGGSGPAPRAGSPAPDFELADLDGGKVKLSDFRGRPVWINFWATWCPPCRAEIPDVEAAYQERKGQGLALLSVSIGEDAETVRQFVGTYGMTSTVLLDPDNIAASLYRINGIPTHLFVDKDGVIRELVVGGLNKGTVAGRLDAIMR